MSVRINITFSLHPNEELKTVDVAGSTVGECLNDFIGQFPQFEELIFDKKGVLLKYVDVYLNNESTYPEGLAKPVKDGDELYIVNIIAGG